MAIVVLMETVTTIVGMFRGSAPSTGPEEQEPNVGLHRLREGSSAVPGSHLHADYILQ